MFVFVYYEFSTFQSLHFPPSSDEEVVGCVLSCCPLCVSMWTQLEEYFKDPGAHSLLTSSTNGQYPVHNVSPHQRWLLKNSAIFMAVPTPCGLIAPQHRPLQLAKITGQSVSALGNSRNTSSSPPPPLSTSFSPSLANSCMTLSVFVFPSL